MVGRPVRGVGLALGLSLLLHAGVAWLVLYLAFTPSVPPPPVSPAVLQVSVTTSNPQRQVRPSEPSVQESAVAPADATNAEPAVTAVPEPPAVASDPGEEPGEDVAEAVAEQIPDAAEPGTGDEAPPPGISAAALQTSVSGYLSSYRSELTLGWLEECQKYRNRYGTHDCPRGAEENYQTNPAEQVGVAELFETWVSGASNHASYSAKLVAETDYLATLMDEDSVVGELVRQRYYQLRAYYCQMNQDNARCTTAATTGSFPSPVDDVITIFSIGN